MPPPYVIITGQGRSGTNWLLDLFDLSPQTRCRNEPYNARGSLLAPLTPHRAIAVRDTQSLQRDWHQAIATTAARMGEHDRPIQMHKHHLRGAARRLGIYRAIRGPRLRRFAALLWPRLRAGEWEPPAVLVDPVAFDRAVPIIKLVQSPGWVVHVLATEPTVPVLHIVRHPGGFLNSWQSRYVAGRSLAEVTAANRSRLQKIGAEHPDWAERFGDVAAMPAVEAELWYWRYATETIHATGRGHPNYELVVYEDLAAEAVSVLRRSFARCGLDWSPDVEQAAETACQSSTAIADKWRSRLDPAALAAVQRVLTDCPLAPWWDAASVPAPPRDASNRPDGLRTDGLRTD